MKRGVIVEAYFIWCTRFIDGVSVSDWGGRFLCEFIV